MPGLRQYNIESEHQIEDYLRTVYDSVLLRDVISREQIRNVPFMENLARFVADNMAQPLSPVAIAKYMKAQGGKVSEVAVSNYLYYLTKALIINPLDGYDLHGKRIFAQNYKYYFADNGLRNFLCGFHIGESIEKLMENAVRLHLLALGYRVKVGTMGKTEIDFIATRGAKTLYFQVCFLLSSEKTVEREFGNLAAIPDNYPKYVISLNPIVEEYTAYPGILHLHLRDFLMRSEY